MQVSTTKFKKWQKQDPQSQTGNPAYEKVVRQQIAKMKKWEVVATPVSKVENANEHDNNHELRHLYKCIHPKAK